MSWPRSYNPQRHSEVSSRVRGWPADAAYWRAREATRLASGAAVSQASVVSYNSLQCDHLIFLMFMRPCTFRKVPAARHSIAKAAMAYQEYREIAVTAAKHAGDIIKQAWSQPRNVMHKGDVDLVQFSISS